MSVRIVYAQENRELDEDLAEANDRRQNKDIPAPTCGWCRYWSGSCNKGKVNRIAACPRCEMFRPRVKNG